MINFIPINRANEDIELSNSIQKEMENVFRYTKEVNIHVIFNFYSPTDVLGKYDYLLLIDIPYEQGNYFRTKNGVYLNSVAIAVKNIEDNDIINVQNGNLITKDGIWNCREEMLIEKESLRHFVYNNMSDVKHFNFTLAYGISSLNYKDSFQSDYLFVNKNINFYQLISYAVDSTKSNDGKKTGNISFSDNSKDNKWCNFISDFIDFSEERTNQGILTKKKIDQITKNEMNQNITKAMQSVGGHLTIISGRAGTGKTHALLRIMFKKIQKDELKRNHRCRFLTYNNLLVMDIKQTLKKAVGITNNTASITTIHKHLFDIYKNSPVMPLHMDNSHIDRIFAKCAMRVSNMVLLLSKYHDSNPTLQIEALKIFDYYYSNGVISSSDAKEMKEFCRYLSKEKYVNYNYLYSKADKYIEEKRQKFNTYYNQRTFLNDYDQILEELYFMFHNIDSFVENYGLQLSYPTSELKHTEEFQKKHGKEFYKFMEEARNKFMEENALVKEEDISVLFSEDQSIINELSHAKSLEEKCAAFEKQIKTIKRKVNWSDLLIIDEAQDCSTYEKALLLELYGSSNTIIATGGRDQLIRTSKENDWTRMFASHLDVEKINLGYRSRRQKNNVVQFVNAFASEFGLDTTMTGSESTTNLGRVIIDLRARTLSCDLPEDKIKELHISGKDSGCSDFENMIILIPGGDYVRYQQSDEMSVNIDENDTVTFESAGRKRSLNVLFPEYIKVLDCTVNNKGELLADAGADKTRVLLYESCRGLEAWNVMCLDLDEFYFDRLTSNDAEDYAISGSDLFSTDEDKQILKEKYAALWTLMAITRAIDTLYIKIAYPNSDFAKRILSISTTLPNVEVIS